MPKRKCSEPGCERPYSGRGLCMRHYHQLRYAAQRAGTWTPHEFPMSTTPAVERFWAKVNKTNTCWLWLAYTDEWGYGTFRIDRTHIIKAHRFAYELLIGPIPEGMELDHLCRIPSCVNPEHLEAVTQRENGRRSDSAPARNARKTHCKYGHEFTPENTRITKTGGRVCQQCHRDNTREYQRRRRAKARAEGRPIP